MTSTIKPPMTLDDIKALRDDAIVAIHEMERNYPSLSDGDIYTSADLRRCLEQTRILLLYMRRIGELPLLSNMEIDLRASGTWQR